MNRKFEIWLAVFNDLEEVTDIQALRDHPVDMSGDTVMLWYVANAQHNESEDIGDHYMALVRDGSGPHLLRKPRYEMAKLEERRAVNNEAISFNIEVWGKKLN